MNMSDRINARLKENVALCCLDKQYEKIEDTALHVLGDIMKDYALEIGGEIKRSAEIGMRSQPNLIDALNTAVAYGYDKEQLM